MCRRDVCRCRPAAGGNIAAPVPPRAKAQPSGPVSGGLHHLLPSPHLSGQPTHAAPPLLGPSGSLPVLGQVISLAAHVHLPEILRTICWLCWLESCLERQIMYLFPFGHSLMLIGCMVCLCLHTSCWHLPSCCARVFCSRVGVRWRLHPRLWGVEEGALQECNQQILPGRYNQLFLGG